MGNKYSITLTLDHGDDGDIPVVAGTSLKGTVTLNVKRKMDPTNLTLHLLGRETTIMNRSSVNPVRDDKIIARAITRLRQGMVSGVRRGVYKIPFDFALPSSLPSSTKFPNLGGRAYSGKIKYLLRLEIGDFEMEREFDVKAAPLPPDIVPCIAQPTTHELKSMGLLNKGFLSVGASVENSRVGRGHKLRVSVASRNETSVEVNRVRVKLMELIEYRAQAEEAVLKVELDKLKDINLPGLDKSKSSTADVRRSIRGGFRSNAATTYQAIHQALLSGDNRFEIEVPNDARDSYNGNLIKISHYLKVTFFTPSMVENPSIKIPLVIGTVRRRPQRTTSRQPNEPIATVIAEAEISDNDTTIEVGSRAHNVPMAEAVLIEQENQPPSPGQTSPIEGDTIIVNSSNVFPCEDSLTGDNSTLPPPMPAPTAPSASVLGIPADDDSRSPPRQNQGSTPHPYHSPPATNPHPSSPYHLNNGSNGRRNRADSYSYDTTTTLTEPNDTPQRLGGPSQSESQRPPNAQWLLEELLRELDGSIHDYEVVVTKLRAPGYKDLFATLTSVEFRSILGHVTMTHQVQVALVLAKQMAARDAFTCGHCAAGLQKTSEYFRSNLVETLIPYCHDLREYYRLIKDGLSEWERVITNRAFDDALGR